MRLGFSSRRWSPIRHGAHFALITRFSLSEAIFLVVLSSRRLVNEREAVRGEPLLLILGGFFYLPGVLFAGQKKRAPPLPAENAPFDSRDIRCKGRQAQD